MEMRIVGISGSGRITIQTKLRKTDVWYQNCITFEEFEKAMEKYFPKYYKFYEIAKENEIREIEENCLGDFERNTYYCADWFYYFGETREMRRKGESFIFTE